MGTAAFATTERWIKAKPDRLDPHGRDWAESRTLYSDIWFLITGKRKLCYRDNLLSNLSNLSNSIDVSTEDRGGETTLHFAASGGELETVKLLLISKENLEGRICLPEAAEFGHEYVIYSFADYVRGIDHVKTIGMHQGVSQANIILGESGPKWSLY